MHAVSMKTFANIGRDESHFDLSVRNCAEMFSISTLREAEVYDRYLVNRGNCENIELESVLQRIKSMCHSVYKKDI